MYQSKRVELSYGLFVWTSGTTEIGRLALKYNELTKKGKPSYNIATRSASRPGRAVLRLLSHAGVKLATLSADPVDAHNKWLKDVSCTLTLFAVSPTCIPPL